MSLSHLKLQISSSKMAVQGSLPDHPGPEYPGCTSVTQDRTPLSPRPQYLYYPPGCTCLLMTGLGVRLMRVSLPRGSLCLAWGLVQSSVWRLVRLPRRKSRCDRNWIFSSPRMTIFVLAQIVENLAVVPSKRLVDIWYSTGGIYKRFDVVVVWWQGRVAGHLWLLL